MFKNYSNQIDVDELLAILKALSKNDDIKLEFNHNLENNFFSWNQNLIDENKIIIPQGKDVVESRAAVDLAASYLLFHDKLIHQNIDIADQNFLDNFEKIRVIACVKDVYKGVTKNILQKISQDFYSSPDFANASLFLLKELFGDDFNRDVDLPKNKINSQIKKIAKNIYDQWQFGLEVKRLLEILNEKKEQEENQEKQPKKLKNQSSNNQENADVNFNEETPQSQHPQGEHGDKKLVEKPEEIEKKISEFSGSDMMLMQLKSAQTKAEDENKIEYKKAYKIYTGKFDEIILPQKLLSKNELEILRYGLELRLDKLSSISKRLTLKLKKKLLAKKNFMIEPSTNEGILDRKKFSQMILDPSLENYFITQKNHEYQNTIVSILLDNSGSMRGQPIVMSALACELIAKILEKFSIKTEILGFTTVDWKGGKSRKMWESQGRANNPGRLSDLRHIVYKSANQNFKKAKINLGLMLKEGILKENIDGEALLWARSRLIQSDQKRKILLVISDGTPVDDSTNSTNDSDILIDHLHHAINLIEKKSRIEVVGIGIGHHVDNFYRNSISIKAVEELGDVMIEKIVDLV